MASMSVSKCLDPLVAIASGNSAVFLFLKSVTFFTSINFFCLFFQLKTN